MISHEEIAKYVKKVSESDVDKLRKEYPYNLICDIFDDEDAIYYVYPPAVVNIVDNFLSEKTQIVIHSRYVEHLTLAKSAEKLGTKNREWVRQLQARALRILRKHRTEIIYWGITINEYNALKDKIKSFELKLEKFNNKINVNGYEIVNMRIDDLELSTRTYNSLRRGGYDTLSDFVNKSYSDVLNLRNMGAKSFAEITEKLKKYGIKLIDDTEGK